MRLLIAGGGTGGHLFPALAIAHAVHVEDPEGKILFVGTRHGIEARVMPQTEFPIHFISARGIRKTGLINTIQAGFEIPLGLIQSVSLIRQFRPDVVLGVGGYASGPTLAAALIMRVPTAIQEQNSVMGTTNRMLSRFVDRIFTSWKETEPPTPAHKTLLAGNPVREDVLQAAAPEKNGAHLNILIFGGSRGARNINLAMVENLHQLTPVADRISVIHQTGIGVADPIRDGYQNAGIQADVREFIDDMGAAYNWADLIVCRSGASTLAEITALGKPAILIPYPYAIGDHQAVNARVLESGGAARVIPDRDLKNGTLTGEIRSFVEKPDQLRAMAENSGKLGRPEAARTIALELLRIARSKF
jgi:UDP-N-acetylglucosamine--N-acetylmuramyl-(pentapeptide) pyrophosphoryl-undecaprenol N-acetylglucosamine transferase